MIYLNNILVFLEGLIAQTLPFVLIIFGGFFISLKGRFFQFKGMISSFKLMIKAVKAPKKKGQITSFSAACTSLSATVGTGNIAGVAGAISLGGAGAVFWMWIASFMGMAVKYGEIALSIKYRLIKKSGEYIGGPMYYMEKLKGGKLFALLFCLSSLPAIFCSGNITQTNAAATVFKNNCDYKFFLGILFFIIVPPIIFGGITRIGNITEKLVPLMSALYIIMCLGVILTNRQSILTSFDMIFKGAFNPKAVTGGVVGSVMQSALTGSARGVFSNEAGLGTSAMVHSVAFDAKENTQGLFGIFEIFLDTILLCTLTALTILCSGVNIEYGKIASTEIVSTALSTCFGGVSPYLLALMMGIFAFSSIIGWAVYGHICSGYVFGRKGQIIFKIIYPLFILYDF